MMIPNRCNPPSPRVSARLRLHISSYIVTSWRLQLVPTLSTSTSTRNQASFSHVINAGLHPSTTTSSLARGWMSGNNDKASRSRIAAASAEVVDVYSGGGSEVEWRKCGDVDLAFPPDFAEPKGIIHFIGGAVVGAFPRSSYSPLLEKIAMEVSERDKT